MKLGIATAPVLFAQRRFPELQKLVERKFEVPGDVEHAAARVLQSDSLSLTRKLACAHAGAALDAIAGLAPCPARDSLYKICDIVCTRRS
jgi:geranylgeranyl pyrophosphate synthase